MPKAKKKTPEIKRARIRANTARNKKKRIEKDKARRDNHIKL